MDRNKMTVAIIGIVILIGLLVAVYAQRFV